MPTHEVQLQEDMSPDGILKLIWQEDGDIIVVAQSSNDRLPARYGAVEFCIPGSGGGRNPHTHHALRDLFRAMEKDAARIPYNYDAE